MVTLTSSDGRVPHWVRVVTILTIAVPQIVTGAWAVVAPQHWFDHFPGVGPLLVASEPPFNAHLASDAGSGFLATGIAVAIAALIARRQLLLFALAIFAIGVIPHVLYHLTNPAPGLTDTENIVNVMMLMSGLAVAGVCAWGTWRPAGPAGSGPAVETTHATGI